MKTRAWVFVAVVLALVAWVWSSCDDAPEQQPSFAEAQSVTSPEPEPEPPPEPQLAPPAEAAPPERRVPDAGRGGWDLGDVVKEPPGTRLTALPSAVRVAVEAAQNECEARVTRWHSNEGALMADLELEATDAGTRVRFTAQGTPMFRCVTRLLEDQRFEVDLPSPKMLAAYFDRRKRRREGSVLPDATEVLALVQKCAPAGVATGIITLSTTARVRGMEVVVDKPVINSDGLDAWARSCIELGLTRTVAFDEDSRPSWSSVTLELNTDQTGKNGGASMRYEP